MIQSVRVSSVFPSRTRSRAHRAASIACVVAIVASSAPVLADKSTVAEELFQEGKKLMMAGKYAEACPKLAQSQNMEPGGGTILALGLCHEKEGKTASAWTELNAALSIATKDGNAGRVKTTKEHLAAIEPRLSRLTVKIPSADAIDGLVLSLDGSAIPKEAWNSALPLDPGPHSLSASAPGKKAWSSKFDVAEGAQPVVEIGVLVDDPTANATTTTTTPTKDVITAGSGQKTAGWIFVGTGVAGLGVGAIFGFRALAKRRDSDHQCPTDMTCTEAGKAFNDQARSAAWVSDIGFGVALISGVIGTYLVLSAPKREPSVNVTPTVTTTGAGFSLTGAF